MLPELSRRRALANAKPPSEAGSSREVHAAGDEEQGCARRESQARVAGHAGTPQGDHAASARARRRASVTKNFVKELNGYGVRTAARNHRYGPPAVMVRGP